MARPQVIQIENKGDELQEMVRGVIGNYVGANVGNIGKNQKPSDVETQGNLAAAERAIQDADALEKFKEGEKMAQASGDDESQRILQDAIQRSKRQGQGSYTA